MTISCAEGERGYIYNGIVKYEAEELDLNKFPQRKTRLMMNIGRPGLRLSLVAAAEQGVGLARMEFVVSNYIKVHPLALVHPGQVEGRTGRATTRR